MSLVLCNKAKKAIAECLKMCTIKGKYHLIILKFRSISIKVKIKYRVSTDEIYVFLRFDNYLETVYKNRLIELIEDIAQQENISSIKYEPPKLKVLYKNVR